MKLVKKLIATVSALAMVTTMATSLVVHAAEDKPIVTPKLVETSTEGVYDLTININNYNLTRGKKLYAIQFGVIIDGTKIDTANSVGNMAYDEDEEADVLTWKYVEYGTEFKAVAKSWNNNRRYGYSWYNLDGVSNSSETGADIVTIKNLKLLDGVTEDVEITLEDIVIEAGKASGTVKYSQANNTVVVNSATIPGATAPVDPTPDKPTVKDDGTILPIKPSDIGGTGDVFVGEDGSKAVAGLGNFTASGVINELNWTIKYTPVGGVETQVTKSFVPAELKGVNVESKVTIGLIVNYSPAEYENVTIVSGALN